jgi:hypothetical protein
MSVSQRASFPVVARRQARFRRCVIPFAALALLASAGGCADQPPAPVSGRDPSDPSARGRPVEYRSTIAPYTSERPVEPAPWGEQNRRVAPAPKQ